MVRTYKNPAEVERVFRTMKSLDIRVRAHIFICLLAYYVEWHMRKALRPMLFDDEQRERFRPRRDPVAPAKPSPSAQKKKGEKSTKAFKLLEVYP